MVYRATAILSVLFLFLSCFSRLGPPQAPDADSMGAADITVTLGKVGALAKTAIDLQTLSIALFSPAEDTVYKTFSLSGNSMVVVNTVFNDLTAKDWTLCAVSYDSRGVEIHRGSTVFTVEACKTIKVTLDIGAGYSMLVAKFTPIVDPVNRCVVSIGSVIASDSTFDNVNVLNDTVRLLYDYLTTGATHNITLDAYHEAGSTSEKLFSGTISIYVTAGKDTSYNVTLYRVTPDNCCGTDSITVTLGSIGTVVINGTIEDKNEGDNLCNCGNFSKCEELVLCLPFNGNAKDQSENGREGVLMGGPTLTRDRFGNENSAYFFDGVDDYMLFDTVDLKLPVTISLWYMTTTVNRGWNTILGWNNHENDPAFEGIQIFTSGTGHIQIRMGTRYDDFTLSPIIVGDSLWHHLIASKDSNNVVKVYVDDNLVEERTISNSIGNHHLLILGRSHQLHYTTEFFQGCIDDVIICH